MKKCRTIFFALLLFSPLLEVKANECQIPFLEKLPHSAVTVRENSNFFGPSDYLFSRVSSTSNSEEDLGQVEKLDDGSYVWRNRGEVLATFGASSHLEHLEREYRLDDHGVRWEIFSVGFVVFGCYGNEVATIEIEYNQDQHEGPRINEVTILQNNGKRFVSLRRLY